jgi:hypothetical protein
MRSGLLAAMGALLLGVLPAVAQEPAQTEQKPKPARPAIQKKTAIAKLEVTGALADVPAEERGPIQAALLWSGDYVGPVKGEDAITVAIKNFRTRTRSAVTGPLTADERVTLLSSAKNTEEDFGWNVVTDPATGIRIGLPTKLVPYAKEGTRGTHWSSKRGEVQIETFRIRNPELTLARLFEREKKEPAGRKIEYSLLRPDNFILSGMQGLKKFSVRAQIRNGEVRGFTMLFDQAMEGIVSPVMVAMASAFNPFPDQAAPYATLSRSVEYGTGLVVTPQGHIVTDRKLAERCQVIVASGIGNAERVGEDKDRSLALLRVYGAPRLNAVALNAGAPQAGDISVIGVPDPREQPNKNLSELKARLADTGGIEVRDSMPVLGFYGAAALDKQGQFIGMMNIRNPVLASAQGAATPPVRLISAETIRGFLAANNAAPAAEANADPKSAVVRIICVRNPGR